MSAGRGRTLSGLDERLCGSHWDGAVCARADLGGVANENRYPLTLPAGDFYLIAVDQSQVNAWSEPGFLAAAARTAIRVSLAWGESKTQGLRFAEIKR